MTKYTVTEATGNATLQIMDEKGNILSYKKGETFSLDLEKLSIEAINILLSREAYGLINRADIKYPLRSYSKDEPIYDSGERVIMVTKFYNNLINNRLNQEKTQAKK